MIPDMFIGLMSGFIGGFMIALLLVASGIITYDEDEE